MGVTRKFLVIDDNADGRSLLARTLIRKFPQAKLFECSDGTTAVECATYERLNAIVLHRTADASGVELIRALRAVRPVVPIIMVSTIDRASEALAAGATRFMLYDEWLCVGSIVADLLAPDSTDESMLEPAQ